MVWCLWSNWLLIGCVLLCFVTFPSMALDINAQGSHLIQGCFTQCPEPSKVPCGEKIETNCYEEGLTSESICEGNGNGLNFMQCLRNSLALLNKPAPCGTYVTDDCGNSCGILSDDVNCEKLYESCGEAVSFTGKAGFYYIQGTKLYCSSDGYALFARVFGSASSEFTPGLLLDRAQFPDSLEPLSQISLTPSDVAGPGEVVQGHVNMSVAQTILSARFYCRLRKSSAYTSYTTTVLKGWVPADYPVEGASEWAIVSIPPHTRSFFVCGRILQASGINGIGLCAGTGVTNSFSNHKATFNQEGYTVIGCAGGASDDPGAEFQLWVKF